MRIDGIFPIPIGLSKIKRKFTDRELDFFNSCYYDTIQNAGNVFTKNTFILNEEVLSDLKTYIEKEINLFFKTVHNPSSDLKLYITQSWVNYTKKGEFHHKHHHPNSFFSGVLYINGSDNVDKITFITPQENIKSFVIDSKYVNNFNYSSKNYYISKGDLIFFPSSLVHIVEPTETEELRVSLAFNTFIEGTLGSENNLTFLKLNR